MPIKYDNGILSFLDQRLLPQEEVYLKIQTIDDCFHAIRDMVVRGAPLIGYSGIWGLALFLKNNPKTVFPQFQQAAAYLKSSRPTAVNLAFEIDRVVEMASKEKHLNTFYDIVVSHALSEMNLAYEKNLAMAKFTEKFLLENSNAAFEKLNLMTLCNTGTLACGVLGTALGAIVYLHSQNKVKGVFASETRPYLQGSRLTSFELLKEEIPHQIVVEGAASYLMKRKMVDTILVGADRIAKNGDTANKVGTSTLSLVAKYYNVPFLVLAPTSSFDLNCHHGDQIEIELRDQNEILKYKNIPIAHPDAKALNPSFDVTDAGNISAIICEKGIISPVNELNLKTIVNKI